MPSTPTSFTRPTQGPFPVAPNAAAGMQRFAASSGPRDVRARSARTASSIATPDWTTPACVASTTAGGPSVGNASVQAAYRVEPTAPATMPPTGTPNADENRNRPHPFNPQPIAAGQYVTTTRTAP